MCVCVCVCVCVSKVLMNPSCKVSIFTRKDNASKFSTAVHQSHIISDQNEPVNLDQIFAFKQDGQ